MIRHVFPGVWDEPLISQTSKPKGILPNVDVVPILGERNCDDSSFLKVMEKAPDDEGMELEERGDILVRGFWAGGTDCVIDVRLTDMDAPSYVKMGRSSEKVIEDHEKAKKRKYLKKCLFQRKSFTPFVSSVDRILGVEEKALLRRLGLKLAQKWQVHYLHIAGYINSRMSITIVRASHLCMRASRIPYRYVGKRRIQCDDGSGLLLYQYLV